MPDYKEMYLTMVRETEKAVRLLEPSLNILIAAQQNCEEMYINSSEPVIHLLDNGLEPKKRRAGKAGNTAPYTEEEKHRIDNILKAFADFIRGQDYFDIVYSEKLGYVQLLTGPEETEPVTVLPTAEDVIETLFYEVTTEVIYDPDNRRPDHDALSEEEETESRRRLTQIVNRMEEDRDHWIAYMDVYFKDYQERFT